ncbi:hypothetical protein QFC21_003316 [Naganishia friedmannii]|uniref:Uncharacterized protein n=1 Tax=Naganishia friedmannii TaxID=89922 RepID=A0ACC2VPJ4_9TREE|nr:hypothetical protein QFC21_003316 [Naganishia friedmannii]
MAPLDLYVAGGIVAVTIIGAHYFKKQKQNSPPWAHASIWQTLNEFSNYPVEFLIKQRKEKGDIFRVNLLFFSITFIIGAKWNRWLLRETKEEDASFYEAVRDWHHGLIDVAHNFPGWHERALKAMSIGLNGPARLEQMSKYFLDIAVPTYQSWEAETSVPLFDFGSELVLRAVLTALLGPAFVHKYGDEVVPMVKSFERDIGHNLAMFLPLWATGVGRGLLRTRRRWKELIEAEVVARLEDPTRCVEAGDYLSYLLTLDNAARYMDCYGEHIVTAITAAHTNSDGTFAWTLLHLVRNPDLLAEYENEIRSNPPLGGRYPIKTMPFSEACLRETGRLYSNLVNLRYVFRDMVAPGGIIIPKGWLAASPLVTQRDPELYPHPEEWEPHRFLSNDPATSYASKFRSHEFVQFGYGRHACLGEKLVHCLLRETLWPTLIDNYRLEVVDGVIAGEGLSNVGVDVTFSEGLGTPFGEREVWIKVTKRDVPLSEEAARSSV